MPIYDIYSRRKKRAEQTEPDVYQYDRIPDTLRTQIQHIWDDAIGPYFSLSLDYWSGSAPPNNNKAWEFIRKAVCHEKGKQSLANESNPYTDCTVYLHQEQDIDELLDLVEFSFRCISCMMSKIPNYEREQLGAEQDPESAIKELNFRFREAGVGYQFEGDQIIRVDSQLVHAEVVHPALYLLSDPRFPGPEGEFRSAHAHYRAGEYKACVTNALNAFESTMKVICDIKGWGYEKGVRATDLVKILRANALLPDYLGKSFDQLIATLSSGLPRVRNEEGAHGQGAQKRATPPYVAAYALHLAAANIVFLVEALGDSS